MEEQKRRLHTRGDRKNIGRCHPNDLKIRNDSKRDFKLIGRAKTLNFSAKCTDAKGDVKNI